MEYVDEDNTQPPRFASLTRGVNTSFNGWMKGLWVYLSFLFLDLRSVVLAHFFRSDSNTEVYMPYLAGYLVKGGYKNSPVPLFQAVYSDYTTTFGAYFPGYFTKHPERLTKQMAQVSRMLRILHCLTLL